MGADFDGKKLFIDGIQNLLKQSIQEEAVKGSVRDISSEVDIEPHFKPYNLRNFPHMTGTDSVAVPEKKRPEKVFFRLWFSTSDDLDWRNFDIILRELGVVKNPISCMVVGNSTAINCELCVAKEDIAPISNTLKTKFPNIQIDINNASKFTEYINASGKAKDKGYSFDLRDFVAPQNYWWPLIDYEALKNSSTPLLSIYSALSNLPEKEFGFFQIIFKSTVYPWEKNIVNLIESEFESTPYAAIRAPILSNSGVGAENYKEARKKLSGPYFATSLRVGTFCQVDKVKGVLDSLSLVISSAQYSDRKFSYLTKSDYLKVVSEKELIEMIAVGAVRRPGTIFTTAELCPLCNLGTKEVVTREDFPLDKAIGFKASEQFLENDGVILGINEYAGKEIIIKQPERIRDIHTSVGGLIGKGKSYLLETMILSDIEKGHGVGVIDPHGDLIERLIYLIPENRIKDCVYFSPCEKDHAVCYNPFELGEGEDIGKKVDDLIVNIRSLFPANAWGQLIESVLMVVFWTLLKGKNLCLADARILLSKTKEAYEMRERLLPIIDNPEVSMFWEDIFERMPVTTIHRVLNKLTMFLLPEKVSRIFSQRTNKIDFRKIIDEKKIFLGYLPAGIIGSDCSNVTGSMIVSGFHNAGMSRANIPPSQRIPFNLYIDEFSRFSVKSFEDCLRELRKYQVRMILAYQQKESLEDSIKLALGNVGTMIVLDVDWKDAQVIYKEFFSEVEYKDLMRKGARKGYVKMGNKIVNFQTMERPQELNGNGFAQKIKDESISKYYAVVKIDGSLKNRQLIKNQKSDKNEILYDEI